MSKYVAMLSWRARPAALPPGADLRESFTAFPPRCVMGFFYSQQHGMWPRDGVNLTKLAVRCEHKLWAVCRSGGSEGASLASAPARATLWPLLLKPSMNADKYIVAGFGIMIPVCCAAAAGSRLPSYSLDSLSTPAHTIGTAAPPGAPPGASPGAPPWPTLMAVSPPEAMAEMPLQEVGQEALGTSVLSQQLRGSPCELS